MTRPERGGGGGEVFRLRVSYAYPRSAGQPNAQSTSEGAFSSACIMSTDSHLQSILAGNVHVDIGKRGLSAHRWAQEQGSDVGQEEFQHP